MFKSLRSKATAAMIASSVWVNNAFAAGLPSAPASTGSSGTAAASGDYIQTLQNYAYDIGILVGLILSTVGFIMVAKNVVTTYGEIGEGRKTYSDMAGAAAAGVLLVVFIVFMLTEAAGIL